MPKKDSFAITLVTACMASIRSLLGPAGCCRFELPCTDFFALQFKDHTLGYALKNILIRLLLCNPVSSVLAPLFVRYKRRRMHKHTHLTHVLLKETMLHTCHQAEKAP